MTEVENLRVSARRRYLAVRETTISDRRQPYTNFAGSFYLPAKPYSKILLSGKTSRLIIRADISRKGISPFDPKKLGSLGSICYQ